MSTSKEFGGRDFGDDVVDDDVEDDGVVVSVDASLAVNASVKQEATRCIESPSGDTTLFSW